MKFEDRGNSIPVLSGERKGESRAGVNGRDKDNASPTNAGWN